MSVHYDPLLAKLTASAESREAAVARARAALLAFPILGIRTNVPFLIRVLDENDFRAGRLHTGFIDEHANALLATRPLAVEAVAAAVAAGPARSEGARAPMVDPWEIIRGWGR